ncbi:MAG: hypothetical protein IJN38_06925 [Clostridia bacterium]|nr:hypothetical protein [Clostridia bacterium]
MPQRKDYDVYAGNQKVGEIWSEHPTKTDYEVDLNIQKQVADLYFEKAKEDKLTSTEWYKAKEAKMEKHYKIRQVIGVLLIIASLIMAVMNVINTINNTILMDSLIMLFIVPPVVFSLGVGLRCTDVITNTSKGTPSIDWIGALGMFGGSALLSLLGYGLVIGVIIILF